MSQEKVMKYKEEKVNRRYLMKKQKRLKYIRNSIMGIISVAIIGWVGYSAVDYYQSNKPREMVEVDYSKVEDYINTLEE